MVVKGMRSKHAPKKAKAFVPTLPAVNLLPPAVMQVEESRRLRRKFVGAGIATVGVVAVLFAGQEGFIQAANSNLQAAQGQRDALLAQQRTLATVGAYYNGVAAGQKAIMQAMSKEAQFADTVQRLKSDAPSGVAIGNINIVVDSVTVTGVQAPGSNAVAKTFTCPTPDPFKPDPAVGCVTLSGIAPSRDAVSQFLNNLNKDGRFVNAFVSTTTVNTNGVAFSATVGVSKDVYSHRYQDTQFLKGDSK